MSDEKRGPISIRPIVEEIRRVESALREDLQNEEARKAAGAQAENLRKTIKILGAVEEILATLCPPEGERSFIPHGY